MIPANLNLSNGENIPPIGLGTYSVSTTKKHLLNLHSRVLLFLNLYYSLLVQGANVKQMVEFSIDIGYRLIDTAFIYRNEKEIGEAISEKLKEGKLKREDLFVVTKVPCTSIGYTLSPFQLDYPLKLVPFFPPVL